MDATERGNPGCRTLKALTGRLLRLLGSLKLALVLLLSLGTTIAAATILEAQHGRTYSQWYVYHSGWFVNLLALLGVNIFCAAAVRWPWKRHQTGFVITHAGLLVLLAGSFRTYYGGVEGQVTLRVGETTSKMTIPNQSQITAVWAGRPEEASYEFCFEHGPVTWREGRALDLGDVDGVRARVLHYYHHAQATVDWIPDETKRGGPSVKLKVDGLPGGAGERVLVDDEYGDEASAGPVRLQLRRATGDAMLQDFLHPPLDRLGKKGLLLAYLDNQVARITVDDDLGKRVPLGETGATIEIVQYLANARPDAHAQFQSAGDEPRNPLLEVRVYLPNQNEPLRQWAFAKSALLNLDPIYGRVCPVKFEYHHPVVEKPADVELLQTSDGRLYWRLLAEHKLVSSGEVNVGDRMEVADQLTVTLVEYYPHVRERVVFTPVAVQENQPDKPDAAAEVAISVGGSTQTVWLQRNHPTYGTTTVNTPEGSLRVKLGNAEVPLGFSLGLVEFHRERNPGGVGNASFSSAVNVIDAAGKEERRQISMNEPLTHNRLTLYQSSFNEGNQGGESSTFSVASDPGRGLKYAGSLMICLGIATMFYMRSYFFKTASRPSGRWGRLFCRWRNAADESAVGAEQTEPESACPGSAEGLPQQAVNSESWSASVAEE